MASNLNKRQIDRFYERLCKRVGEYCEHCQKTIEELGVKKLEIHHKNGDTSDCSDKNLCLLCHGCNHLLIFRKKKLMQEREHTPEHKKSIEKKPIFLRWLSHKIQENNFHYNYDEIIGGGAYLTGCDVTTIRRWIRPLLSEEGPFSLSQNQLGELCVYLKGKEPFYEIDEQVKS